MTAKSETESAFRSIVLTRTYDAPRELVFAAWIEPNHLLQWFRGSQDWTTPFAETDPRAGGAYRIGFGSPDGKNDFVFEGRYEEVTPPSRLVFTIADGRPITVTFTELNGKTKLDLVLSLENTHSEEQQREGWGNMLRFLAEHLAKH